MDAERLSRDPFNVLIAGVGGQGNVLASKLLGNVLLARGYNVTVGETFGASQRGGSVMSHLRVSGRAAWSPQIPGGRADVILALEPMEALRALAAYGNPEVVVIANSRPVYPVAVICGEREYPPPDRIRAWLERSRRRAWLIDATGEALRLGAPVYANIVMIGALAAAGVLPLRREDVGRCAGAGHPKTRAGSARRGGPGCPRARAGPPPFSPAGPCRPCGG